MPLVSQKVPIHYQTLWADVADVVIVDVTACVPVGLSMSHQAHCGLRVNGLATERHVNVA